MAFPHEELVLNENRASGIHWTSLLISEKCLKNTLEIQGQKSCNVKKDCGRTFLP